MSTTSLSKYRMIVELARGGMGEVFLAVSRGPGGFHKLVVIKELRASLSSDTEFLSMFMDEARLSARLHHPNIVQTNEVGQDGNRYFMAMEYLEGQTLQRCVQKIGKEQFSPAMQMRILADALGALHYAHELADYDGTPLHIVHRDISPHNIMITYDGQAKILDFGIAKTRESAQETATGVLKGKVPYMAPEQLEHNQDRRADIFAVGVMLWEAAAGSRLWAGKTDLGIVQALAEQKIPSLRDAKPDVSPVLERIVARALAPKAADRYPTALEFATDLEAYLDAAGAQVSTKQIGKLVSTAFATEREHIRSVVDEQLRRVRSADSDSFEASTTIPKLDVSQGLELTPSGEARNRSTSGKTPAASAIDANASAITGTGARASAPKKNVAAWAIGSGVAVVGALVALGMVRHEPPSAASAPAAPPTPVAIVPAAPPAPAAAPSQVELVVTASPPDARVFIDDAPVGSNPYKALVPKGGAHRIRAEAPGYLAATQTKTFDGDLVVSLVLDRARAEKTGGRAWTRPAKPAPAPAPTPSTRSTPAPHTIDSSDPYAK